MLSISGRPSRLCDGLSRRAALQVGGLSLFPSLTMPGLLRAASDNPITFPPCAKSVILVNLLGGPPHQDLFDLKPEAAKEVRGEFSPIATAVPGTDIGELLRRQQVALQHRLTIHLFPLS